MFTHRQQQGSSVAIKENQLLGDWLIEQGHITAEQLEAALADQ